MADTKPQRSNFSRRVESIFEGLLWKSRFIVMLAVIFGLFGSVLLFIAGSVDILIAFQDNFGRGGHINASSLVGGIIGAVDLYLIAIVILLFSFGIYELFISKIDIARQDRHLNVLEIKDLDDLKTRILKVIIMVLVVSFFKQVLDMKFTTLQEMIYFALSILALSITTYFIRKQD